MPSSIPGCDCTDPWAPGATLHLPGPADWADQLLGRRPRPHDEGCTNEGPYHKVRAFVRVSGASGDGPRHSPASGRCPHRGDQLPVSFSRRAASASSEARVPSAGAESAVDDDEEEPFESGDDEPFEE